MAEIKETLTLENKFSATLDTYIKMMSNSEASTKQVNAVAKQATQQARVLSSAYRATANQLRAETEAKKLSIQSARAASAESRALTSQLKAEITAKQLSIQNAKAATAESRALAAQLKAEAAAKKLSAQETEAARKAQEKLNQEMSQGRNEANSLAGAIKGVVGAYMGIQGVKALLNISDELTSTNARLKMMNDGLQTTEELNNMIFQSAQRSRGAYQDTADMVAKLGTLAGDAFNNNSAEIVAFAEQINKQMALSGTSTIGVQAAMLQLTQAMSSGVLRGEELNSILEHTPLIAQTIAEYLGVSTGEMRNLASEGAITAEIVKNAMFDVADKTNEKFEQMPYTWSQVFTSFQNTALQTFEPILNGMGLLATDAAENIDLIAPVFYGAAAAAMVFAAGTAIANGSLVALSATLFATPIGWIALLIGGMVGIMYSWAQSVGGVSVAWLILKNAALSFVEDGYVGIVTFTTNVQNAFGTMKVIVLNNFQDMVNGAIDGINKLASFANKALGTSFGMIDYITIGTEAAIENEAAQSARNAELSILKMETRVAQAKRAREIAQKQSEATAAAANSGFDYSSLASDQALNGIASDVGNIKSSTASIAKSVDMSKEDIKSLVDVATRQYVNKINLTSQTPIITVNGANTGNTEADRKALADKLRDIILEQAAASSYRSTALPV